MKQQLWGEEHPISLRSVNKEVQPQPRASPTPGSASALRGQRTQPYGAPAAPAAPSHDSPSALPGAQTRFPKEAVSVQCQAMVAPENKLQTSGVFSTLVLSQHMLRATPAACRNTPARQSCCEQPRVPRAHMFQLSLGQPDYGRPQLRTRSLRRAEEAQRWPKLVHAPHWAHQQDWERGAGGAGLCGPTPSSNAGQ